MNIFLTLAFLFFIGATLGWVLELLFRRFFSSANPERKWINPGFCVGPYLPLYGCGLCFLYLIASLEQFSIIRDPFWNRVVLFLIMAVCMTVTEYFAGLIALKGFHVRLWDYSKQWGNIQGLICPKFSLAWAMLSRNLAFSFVIGLFYGVFLIDVVYSTKLIHRIKKLADENEVIVKYENLKAHIRSVHDRSAQKASFFFPLRSERPLNEHLRELRETLEQRRRTGGKKHAG